MESPFQTWYCPTVNSGPPNWTRTTRIQTVEQTTTPDLQLQENTRISCIRADTPKLDHLPKLDEKARTCKNRSENFLRGGAAAP